LKVLPWDSEAVKQYRLLRATVEVEGQPTGNFDVTSAAHALALNAILVTNDHAVTRMRNLEVEDWTEGSRH
jgi:tRNA(fMet)-specific endonuclease VapC